MSRIQAAGVADVGFDQAHAGGDGGAVALPQIVVNHDRVAAVGERLDEVAADVAGASGDEITGHARQPRGS
jgi:hypothetical protein